MKYTLLLVAIFFTSLQTFAQTFALSGTVADKGGKPIPFATVYIRNTTKGTSANSEGKYQLQLAAGSYEVFYRAVGFKQESRKVDLKANQTLDVSLGVESYEMKAVTIHAGGEDPAYAIIRKAIKKRKFYLTQVNAYSTEVYIKGMQKLLSAPKKFLGTDIDKIARENGLDSNRRGIIYLSESQSKYTFMQPDKVHEEMISSKVSGRNNAFSFNRASDIQVNFYQNVQDWEGINNRPFVSPIAENALFYYKYELLGTTQENGETIDKIKVTPKRGYDPAFEGVIYIVEDSWRIYGVDLFMSKRSNINFVDTLRINEQFYPVNKNVWMPASIKFEFTGGFFGFKFGGCFISIYKDYDLAPVIDKKDFHEVLKITKEVNKKDSAYWNLARPVPLTNEETVDYKNKEVLALKRESKPYLDSIDRTNNIFKLGQFIYGSGYHHRNRYDKEYYNFSSLTNALLFNTVEGFAFNYDASYVKQIDSLNNRYLSLGAKVRYGFSNHKVHGSVYGNVPLDQFNLGFNVGSDVLDMNNRSPISSTFNTFHSLFQRKNFEKLYDKEFASVSLSRRITGGWQASVSTEYSSRTWLDNTSNYSFFHQNDRVYTSNNPLSPNTNTPLFPDSKAFKIGARTTYDFSNSYETLPNGRHYFPSKYPTIGLSYTKGIKDVFGSDVDYDLLSFDISKSDINMGFYGKTSFYVAAGKFLNNRQLFYTDYKQFTGNQLTVYEPSLTQYMLLDYYKYSTGDEYLEGHLEHNFSGFITNKIPLIRKLKLEEIVDVNYLATPALRNYAELGFGLQYLAFRAMYGLGYQNGTRVSNGFRIGLLISPRRRRN